MPDLSRSETCSCGLNLRIWQNPWNHDGRCSMTPVRRRLIRAVEQEDGSIVVYVKPYQGYGEVPELILSVVGGSDLPEPSANGDAQGVDDSPSSPAVVAQSAPTPESAS